MKTLSPPDRVRVHIHLVIDPVGIVRTKLKSIIEKNYGFKVKDTASILKISLTTPPNRFRGLINSVNAMLREIQRYNVKLCLDYYVKIKGSTCICSKPFRFGNRAYCIEEISEAKLIHIYCNEEKGEVVIRFFKTKPTGSLDLVLTPKSLFIECNDADSVAKTLSERAVGDVELLLSRITGGDRCRG